MNSYKSIHDILKIKSPQYKTFLIAGPCSVESEEQIMQTAFKLSKYEVNVLRGGIWKPRTRPSSFQGMGIQALPWLKNAGKEANIPVCVEVAKPDHVEQSLKYDIDILWIGARTTTNPFSVQTLVDCLKGIDKPIMIKNPISPDIQLWLGAFDRFHNAGIERLIAIHRGFYSHMKTVFRNEPCWRIPIELKRTLIDVPLLCDASHICGNREWLHTISQKAMDLLFDGLMIEVHTNPNEAWSDSKQQIVPDDYKKLVDNLKIKKPYSDNTDFFKRLREYRSEMDDVDNQLIELLSERMNLSRQIGSYKKRAGVSKYQPDRWNEIIRSRTQTGKSKNLSEDFIFRIYQLIHEESLRQQEPEGSE
ncbi:MAG: bifunctional 3-deoxy-7-phosphoheptulonate synthase/chorismate mutase type II [Candidatus Aminicenantaceae bacterium]